MLSIEPSVSHSSNIKDYWWQITIYTNTIKNICANIIIWNHIYTNVMVMKKFEILWELPKCDTGNKVNKCCWWKRANRLDKVATDLQFIKKMWYLWSTMQWSTIRQGISVHVFITTHLHIMWFMCGIRTLQHFTVISFFPLILCPIVGVLPEIAQKLMFF